MAKIDRMAFSCANQKELAKLLRAIAHRHGIWQVFKDFVALCALSISNSMDLVNFDEREAEYMRIIRPYEKNELYEFRRGLDCITDGLETGHQDFLGSLFMGMELGDSWKGQFFTPYEVCLMMAKMTIGDNARIEIEKKGFISCADPCVGAGSMVIAAAHAMLDDGLNYQQHLHAVATDIDIVAVHMAYIQFSLFHIPAVVYHGNSLSGQVHSVWKTPSHILGFWDSKLRRESSPTEIVTYTPPQIQVPVKSAEIDQIAEISIPPHWLNIREQMALF
jgi:hypothetical protein